jgi:hypothetical protein
MEKLYDAIAETYNQKISADVLATANQTAHKLTQQLPNSFEHILALGVRLEQAPTLPLDAGLRVGRTDLPSLATT